MTNTKTSSGTAVGRAIGSTAAHSVHFVAVALTATGRFGSDVVTGSATGYAETSATRLAQRNAARAALLAASQPETPIGVVLTA
jgi:hypothetical protein